MYTRRHSGQALPFVAVCLLFLVPFVVVCLEVGGRMLQRSQAEQALQQATRSAVQTFAYDQFAQGSQELRSEAEVATLASRLFAINLTDARGLSLPPTETARLVSWTVLPNGGSCTVSGKTCTFSSAAICASVELPLNGLIMGAWQPRLETAATIDRTPPIP